MERSGFDDYADDYEGALGRGLALSGEDSRYFALGRIAWLKRQLDQLGHRGRVALDYGCGTGATTSLLLSLTGAESVIGIDVSERSLEVAMAQRDPRMQFVHADSFAPAADVDVAYCNGVFHHIAPEERAAAARCIHRSLRSGGIFAMWENNPWNPGTRWVMHRIPFDRDAIMLSPPEARRLLGEAGFETIRTDFLFIFPRPLGWLRFLEPWLSSLPLGGQYMVLARKIDGATQRYGL